jgi:hypothetical protein
MYSCVVRIAVKVDKCFWWHHQEVEYIVKTSLQVITRLKGMFVRCGIPTEIVCDNSTQFICTEFEFRREYGFAHTTSSPYYPRRQRELHRPLSKFLNNQTHTWHWCATEPRATGASTTHDRTSNQKRGDISIMTCSSLKNAIRSEIYILYRQLPGLSKIK